MQRAGTLGELRRSGYQVVPVRQEMRRNLLGKLARAERILPGIIGFEDTVMPEIENAVLAGHHMVFLGERGQAKSRIIRGLTSLLDAEVPVVHGCAINDSPLQPICKECRRRLAELGDDLPVSWISPEIRYGEKLATPDVSIADLIGEIDPVKVAEGRYLADEETIHYGIIPRTNRGIFAINELPDLTEKVQVVRSEWPTSPAISDTRYAVRHQLRSEHKPSTLAILIELLVQVQAFENELGGSGDESRALDASEHVDRFAQAGDGADTVEILFGPHVVRHCRSPAFGEISDHAAREQLRQRYREHNLKDAFEQIRRRLEDLLDLERRTLEEQHASGSDVTQKLAFLDSLPQPLLEALERLKSYEFENAKAGQEFESLLEELQDLKGLEEFRRRFGDLFHGPKSLNYEEAISLMREAQRLKQLEEQLLGSNLEDIDAGELGALLGEPMLQALRHLQQIVQLLEQAGYLTKQAGRLSLSPKGVRKIGELALREIYQHLLRERSGNHRADHRGVHEPRPDTTHKYRYGDLLHLDLVGTIKNALPRKRGTPLELHPNDFEVFATDHATSTSTVLLLDMSWSMSWEGRFAAAKKVALAMETLIHARYPRDYFAIVGFFTRAVELKLKDLPEASWNMGDPFTNLQDGLRLARELLSRHPSNNQHIIVITDGQPTAYFPRGRLYCEWPLSFGGISMRAAQETLKEVERVTRKGIVINTFMLDDSTSLRAFVERMTRINKGRALYTRPDQLGQYLLVDYIGKKRKRV